jgi:hypothetical protein
MNVPFGTITSRPSSVRSCVVRNEISSTVPLYPHAREEVLEDVLKREADDEADHAERGEDPTERVAGIDRDDRENAHRDDRELGEVAEKDRDVRLGAAAGKHAHRPAAHRSRDQERDRGDDERPERSRAVVEEVVADDRGVERHRRRIRGRLTSEHPFGYPHA